MDIAKLIIGGVLLASIVKEDIDKVTLYSMGVFIFLGIIACFMGAFALWGIFDLRKQQ